VADLDELVALVDAGPDKKVGDLGGLGQSEGRRARADSYRLGK
jgi:hypothetical protein